MMVQQKLLSQFMVGRIERLTGDSTGVIQSSCGSEITFNAFSLEKGSFDELSEGQLVLVDPGMSRGSKLNAERVAVISRPEHQSLHQRAEALGVLLDADESELFYLLYQSRCPVSRPNPEPELPPTDDPGKVPSPPDDPDEPDVVPK